MATILVVEDEPAVRRVMARALERAGHLVVVAGSGSEAISVAASTHVDTAVIDLRMAPLDGIATTELLHEEHPRLPVMLVSGYQATAQEWDRAMRAGLKGFLAKPFTLDQFCARVAELLKGGDVRRQTAARRLGRLKLALARINSPHDVTSGREILTRVVLEHLLEEQTSIPVFLGCAKVFKVRNRSTKILLAATRDLRRDIFNAATSAREYRPVHNALRIIQQARTAALRLHESDLAMAVGVSSTYLSHQFSSVFGYSFRACCAATVLTPALRDLGTSRLPIKQIAADAGFPIKDGQVRGFDRLVRKLLGVTPTEFREIALVRRR